MEWSITEMIQNVGSLFQLTKKKKKKSEGREKNGYRKADSRQIEK